MKRSTEVLIIIVLGVITVYAVMVAVLREDIYTQYEKLTLEYAEAVETNQDLWELIESMAIYDKTSGLLTGVDSDKLRWFIENKEYLREQFEIDAENSYWGGQP